MVTEVWGHKADKRQAQHFIKPAPTPPAHSDAAFGTLKAFTEWLCLCDVGTPQPQATTATMLEEYKRIMSGAQYRCNSLTSNWLQQTGLVSVEVEKLDSDAKRQCADRLDTTGRLPPFPALATTQLSQSLDIEQRMPACAVERLRGMWPPKHSRLARAVSWARKTKILMIGDSTVDAKVYLLGRLGVQTEACSTGSKKYKGGLCTMRTNQQFMYAASDDHKSSPHGWPVLARYPAQSNNKFQLVIWNIGLHLLDRAPAPAAKETKTIFRKIWQFLQAHIPFFRSTRTSAATAPPKFKIDLHLATLKRNAAALREKYPNAKHVYLLTNRMCSKGFGGELAQHYTTWRHRSGQHGNNSIEYDDRMQFSHVGTENWNHAEQELSKEGWIIFDPAVGEADCVCTHPHDGRHYLLLATSFWERMFEMFGGD